MNWKWFFFTASIMWMKLKETTIDWVLWRHVRGSNLFFALLECIEIECISSWSVLVDRLRLLWRIIVALYLTWFCCLSCNISRGSIIFSSISIEKVHIFDSGSCMQNNFLSLLIKKKERKKICASWHYHPYSTGMEMDSSLKFVVLHTEDLNLEICFFFFFLNYFCYILLLLNFFTMIQ